jgi:hypothetical protein
VKEQALGWRLTILALACAACSSSPTDLPPPTGPSYADVQGLTATPNPAVAGRPVTISFRPVRSGGTSSDVAWDATLSESGFVRNLGSLAGASPGYSFVNGVARSGELVSIVYNTVAPTEASVQVGASPYICFELSLCSNCCGSLRSISVTVLPAP